MYCEKLFEGLDKRLNEQKSIDQIADELCPTVVKKRDKIIALIKSHKGGGYLIQNHDWLKYHKENIRNHNIIGCSERLTPDHRLKKPSLNTIVPTPDQYNTWIEYLNDSQNKLNQIYNEISHTTEAKHTWRLKTLIARIKELKTFLNSQSINTNKFNDITVKNKYG